MSELGDAVGDIADTADGAAANDAVAAAEEASDSASGLTTRAQHAYPQSQLYQRVFTSFTFSK